MSDEPRRKRRRSLVVGVLAAIVIGVCTATCSASSTAGRPDGLAATSGSSALDQGLLLDESFDGNTLDRSVWNTCHWWTDGGCTIGSNNELEWYLPEQVAVANGSLNLEADRRSVVGTDGKKYRFASGMVTTGPPAHDEPAKLAFTYGTVEVRVKLPPGRGLWPAIWLLPASEQSRPEIDLLEMRGSDPTELSMHLHPKNRSAESLGKTFRLPAGSPLTAGWHTISLDWKPGRLGFFLDGKQLWKIVDDQVPDEPMYLVMNLAVGGDFPGAPDKTTRFPADFRVDHVRIHAND